MFIVGKTFWSWLLIHSVCIFWLGNSGHLHSEYCWKKAMWYSHFSICNLNICFGFSICFSKVFLNLHYVYHFLFLCGTHLKPSCVGLSGWWKILSFSVCFRGSLFSLLKKNEGFAGCNILGWHFLLWPGLCLSIFSLSEIFLIQNQLKVWMEIL